MGYAASDVADRFEDATDNEWNAEPGAGAEHSVNVSGVEQTQYDGCNEACGE